MCVSHIFLNCANGTKSHNVSHILYDRFNLQIDFPLLCIIPPCISPLIHDNKFMTDFKQTLNFHLNVKEKHLIHYLLLDSRVMKSRESIKKLDPNKVHGPDMISICMLKICGSSISKPYQFILRSCVKNGVFGLENYG